MMMMDESTIKIVNDEDWDVLLTISEALESWSDRVCNLETVCRRTSDYNQKVIDSLNRQLLDGLISQGDVKELGYAADIWQKLYISFNCKVLGCEFSTEDVLNHLLELYSLNLISKEFFIKVALKVSK